MPVQGWYMDGTWMVQGWYKDGTRMVHAGTRMVHGWMISKIKQKLKEKKKIYNKYVKNKYDLGYEQLLHEKMIETNNLIANAKENYYQNEGKKLLNISLGPKGIGRS